MQEEVYKLCIYKVTDMSKDKCELCNGRGVYFDIREGEYKKCEEYKPMSDYVIVYGD